MVRSNQIPVTADDAGGRKQAPFSFSFLPALQRRELWTCQLCTFGLHKTGSLKWDFYDASREKFPFHFFSVLAGRVFSLSHTIFCLIPPYLPRTWLECVRGAEREAAVLCTPPLPTALHFLNSSSVPSCRTTQCFALSFSWADISPGAAGLDWGAAGSSHQQPV